MGLAWINRRAIVGAILKRNSHAARRRRIYSGSGQVNSTTSSQSGWGADDASCTQKFFGGYGGNSSYSDSNRGKYVPLNMSTQNNGDEEVGSGWDDEDGDWENQH